MATFEFNKLTNSITITVTGSTQAGFKQLPQGSVRVEAVQDSMTVARIVDMYSDEAYYTIDLQADTLVGLVGTPATAEELAAELDVLFFDDAAGGGGGVDFSTVNQIAYTGNIAPSQFDSSITFNTSVTEYYSADTVLQPGNYNNVEIQYFDRNSANTGAILYVILLNESLTTIQYNSYTIPVDATVDGVFNFALSASLTFEEAVNVKIMIGRRKWNATDKQISLYTATAQTSGASSVATGLTNPSLQVDDTSAIDWTGITFIDTATIIEAKIY